MRYFVIFLALAINIALVKSQGESSEAYTYVIEATRTDNVIAPGYPVVYMYYQVLPTQNITYFRSVGPDDPLLIEGFIYNDDSDEVYFSNDGDHLLNSCEKQPNNSWPFVLIQVVNKTVLLGDGCSVNKGSYMIDQNVEPITVTFDEMIRCGTYTLIFNAYVPTTKGDLKSTPIWGFQLGFTFEIPHVGNCN